MTESTKRHPFWLTHAHQHDSGRVCLLNHENGNWYIESGPGSSRVRDICDREHPEMPEFVQVWSATYDDETPFMDGTRNALRMAERRSREEAEADVRVIHARSARSPKRNLRIETRWVSEWNEDD